MDLFSKIRDPNENILPGDGIVNYYGPIMSISEANHYYDRLMDNIQWENDIAVMFGKRIVTKRKVGWYGEKPFPYTYSNNTKTALPWTQELLDLRILMQEQSGETFNSCLLNLYHDGSEGMAYHSDGEKDLKKNGAIASLTFGAERKFSFKHKETKQRIDIMLENGSLLMMKGTCQKNWMHRLPPTKKVNSPRINLTFRTIVEGQGG